MWRKWTQFDRRKMEAATDGNQGSGGQPQQPANTNQQNQQQNNDGNNDSLFANMWQDDKPDSTQQAAPNNQQQQQTRSAQEIFDEHYNSLNIGSGFDLQEVTRDIQSGGIEKLADFANTLGKDIYRAAISQTSKLVEAKISKAVDEAVNKANGNFNSKLAIEDLNRALPFTKDPTIAPVAEGVFARFIKKGQNVTDAIANTKKYFEHTFKIAGKHINTQSPSGKPGSGRFSANSNSNAAEDEQEDTDWMELLGGG